MSSALLSLMLLAQVGGTPPQGQKSLAEPFKDILPTFGLNTQTELQSRAEITRRALIYREEFLVSQQAKRWPDTLGLFLSRADYARMKGNTIFGYWWATPNFVWKPEWKAVSFTAPKGLHQSSRMIQPRAWDKAMEMLAAQKGLTLSPSAPVKITGAVVGATIDPVADHTRGFMTLCEWRVETPGGGLLVYRYAVMKPTLGGAIGGNLAWIVSYARGLDGKPKQFGKFQISGTGKGLSDGPKKR